MFFLGVIFGVFVIVSSCRERKHSTVPGTLPSSRNLAVYGLFRTSCPYIILLTNRKKNHPPFLKYKFSRNVPSLVLVTEMKLLGDRQNKYFGLVRNGRSSTGGCVRSRVWVVVGERRLRIEGTSRVFRIVVRQMGIKNNLIRWQLFSRFLKDFPLPRDLYHVTVSTSLLPRSELRRWSPLLTVRYSYLGATRHLATRHLFQVRWQVRLV